MKTLRILLASICFSFSISSSAMDFDGFRSLAQHTVRQMNMGVAGDIDALIAMQEELMVIGMQGGVKYLQLTPEGGVALQTTILNAESMKKLSLDQIEELWHEGKFLQAKGIDTEHLDHFGAEVSLMDAIIHPATSYLALRAYRNSGDPELLTRAKAELVEVLIHLDQLEQSQAGRQLLASGQ